MKSCIFLLLSLALFSAPALAEDDADAAQYHTLSMVKPDKSADVEKAAAKAKTEKAEDAASENKTPSSTESNDGTTLVVTGLETCLAKLDKAEADDIRLHYTMPYGECIKRIKAKEQTSNKLNVSNGSNKSDAPTSQLKPSTKEIRQKD